MSHFSKSSTLVIFDVDGTLVDGHVLDNDSFALAFREVAGVALTEAMWSEFKEVTGPAVVRQALGDEWPDLIDVEAQIKSSFVQNLRQGHGENKDSIRAFPGAVEFLSALQQSPDFEVAIATGCWRESAHFKLAAAGFDISGIPFACSSDQHTRAEIILLAAERAGRTMENAIYVGDGRWDLRATQQLRIPFIGVGKKIEALRKAGAEYTLDVFEMEAFLRVLGNIRR